MTPLIDGGHPNNSGNAKLAKFIISATRAGNQKQLNLVIS
jgi:hypothetical protein